MALGSVTGKVAYQVELKHRPLFLDETQSFWDEWRSRPENYQYLAELAEWKPTGIPQRAAHKFKPDLREHLFPIILDHLMSEYPKENRDHLVGWLNRNMKRVYMDPIMSAFMQLEQNNPANHWWFRKDRENSPESEWSEVFNQMV